MATKIVILVITFLWGVSIIVFMRIISIKRGYGMAFMCIVTLKNVFSMKSDYRNFGGMGENL